MLAQNYDIDKSNKLNFLTSAHLKTIAVICMLIDHIGAAFSSNLVWFNVFVHVFGSGANTNNTENLFNSFQLVILLMRAIGRISFPIFCFLIMQGFIHTKNVKKYMLRLAAFAIVSEIPFNLQVGNGNIFNMHYQNVFFTLTLGLLTICFYKNVKAFLPVKIIVVILIAIFATLINADYGFFGVITIFLFYAFYKHKYYFTFLALWLAFGSYFVGIVISCFNGYSVEQAMQINLSMGLLQGLCAFSLLFIAKYNNKKGKQLSKYFFYLFYPLHLLLLYFAQLFMSYIGF